MYYQILPDRKVPQVYLTYSYESELQTQSTQTQLKMGQIVEMNIRGGSSFGIVIKEVQTSEIHFDLTKIKPLTRILPFQLSEQQISFIFSLSQNTFNSLNLICSATMQFLDLIGIKEMRLLEQEKEMQKNLINRDKTRAILEKKITTKIIPNKPIFYLETEEIPITVRIRYIIRTNIDLFPTSSAKSRISLVIFPEKKLLDKIYKNFAKTELSQIPDAKLLKFSGDKLKHSKETLKEILSEQPDKHLIIFSTRAGLFLPYSDIEQIILIDESSSFHIQDQNQIYYDTRDAVFFLSQAHNSKLAFVSTTPSVRLFQFYDK